MAVDTPEISERPRRSNIAFALGKTFAATITLGGGAAAMAPTNEAAVTAAGIGLAIDALRLVGGWAFKPDESRPKGRERTHGPATTYADSILDHDNTPVDQLPSVRAAMELSGSDTSTMSNVKPYDSGDYGYDTNRYEKWSKARAKREMKVTKR